MITEVIFDLDGLLIDSEPLWRKAYISVFASHGIELTEDMCRSTTGMRVDEAVKYWSVVFPEKNIDCEKVEKEMIDTMVYFIKKEGKSMPGVKYLIDFLKNKGISISVASASATEIITAALVKMNIINNFKIIQSAENLEYGKPNPQVFIETMKRLNTRPENCLVFEDSAYGVLAGKAALMKVVAVPDKEVFNKKEYCIADIKLKSLTEFNEKKWEYINSK